MFLIRIPEFNLNGNVSGLPRDKKYIIQIFWEISLIEANKVLFNLTLKGLGHAI